MGAEWQQFWPSALQGSLRDRFFSEDIGREIPVPSSVVPESCGFVFKRIDHTPPQTKIYICIHILNFARLAGGIAGSSAWICLLPHASRPYRISCSVHRGLEEFIDLSKAFYINWGRLGWLDRPKLHLVLHLAFRIGPFGNRIPC